MNRGRVLRLALILVLGVVIVGGVVSWALPALIRRLVLDEISRHTGRAASIGHVRVNPLTGRLTIGEMRVAEREAPQMFLELPRLEMRFVLRAFLRSDIRLAELTVVAPSARLVRTRTGEFNVSDLLSFAARTSPRRWTVTVDRLTISNGSVHAHDEAVTPPTDWEVRELELELHHLTTRPGAPPGSGVARARVDEAKVELTGEPLKLEPLAAVVQITLEGFELRRLGPYMSHAGAPYHVKGGRLAAALTAAVDHAGEELTKAALAGTVRIEDEAVARTAQDEPFLQIPRATVNVKEADAITRALTISSAAVEGAELRVRRDARGVIDLLDIVRQTAAGRARPDAAAPAPSPTVSRRLVEAAGALALGFQQIHIERVTLGPSTFTFVDRAIKPPTTLTLSRMQTTMTDFTWPAKQPAALELSAVMPGGGTVRATGSVLIQPFEAELATVLRNANVQPYQAYVPGVAQLRGRVSGNSRTRISLGNGTMRLVSTGDSRAEGVEARAPGATSPAFRVEHMALVGIDVDWPRRVSVAKATFRRPEGEIVREADGSFDVAKLFRAPPSRGRHLEADAAATPAASVRSEGPKVSLEKLKLDFREVRVEDGFVRFLDRTTSPAFSKDVSRLSMVVSNLGNRPGQRARLEATSIVGGDSALDLRGEVGAIGSPASVDLVGELEGLPLAGFNPYAGPAIGWVVKNGDLHYKIHFKLDDRALAASNEMVVGQLRVAPAGGADWVRQQIGVPLSLIVALAKNEEGEIRATVPVSGSIDDPKFDFRRAMWRTLTRALARLVRNPFRAISHSLRDTDTIEVPTIDPVTFAPGSSVIGPDMEQHLLRVADVLRRKPFVNLALAPVVGAGDVEALKAQTLSDTSREFQALLTDLSRRRVDATREWLTSVEGIPAERLANSAPVPNGGASVGDGGRVELSVVAGDE